MLRSPNPCRNWLLIKLGMNSSERKEKKNIHIFRLIDLNGLIEILEYILEPYCGDKHNKITMEEKKKKFQQNLISYCVYIEPLVNFSRAFSKSCRN